MEAILIGKKASISSFYNIFFGLRIKKKLLNFLARNHTNDDSINDFLNKKKSLRNCRKFVRTSIVIELYNTFSIIRENEKKNVI